MAVSRNKVFIIAEAGVNHNGDLSLAKKIIDAARFSNADAVKFQAFRAKNIVTKFAQKAPYQKVNTKNKKSQLDMLKELELSFQEQEILAKYCRQKEIIYMCSPFDLESVDMLLGLKLKIMKIPSGEITNYPLLKKIGSLRKKIILSTGMSYLYEIKDALNLLISSGTLKKDITVLQCNSEYPTPVYDVNLLAMLTIKEKFKVNVGYSDHTLSIAVPVAAAALGATVIEKHLTIDKRLPGPDQASSFEPKEFKAMVEQIRDVEQALGCHDKIPSLSEIKNKEMSRKSIVAARDISRGEKFSDLSLTVKRPAGGVNPMKWPFVIGRIAKRNFKQDEPITL